MKRSFIAGAVTGFLSAHAFGQDINASCTALTKDYSEHPLYDEIASANSTNIGVGDFYDNVVCECRLNESQSVNDAIRKASSAINAGLWAAEPIHHDLSQEEEREADAFTRWVEGRGARPQMKGVLACVYARANTETKNQNVPFTVTKNAGGSIVSLLVKSDNLTVVMATVNRGNCRAVNIRSAEFIGNPVTGVGFPASAKFGETIQIGAVVPNTLFGDCNTIEIVIDTDKGSWTFTWDH